MDISATLSIPTPQSQTKESTPKTEISLSQTALAISIGMVLWAILVLIITA